MPVDAFLPGLGIHIRGGDGVLPGPIGVRRAHRVDVSVEGEPLKLFGRVDLILVVDARRRIVRIVEAGEVVRHPRGETQRTLSDVRCAGDREGAEHRERPLPGLRQGGGAAGRPADIARHHDLSVEFQRGEVDGRVRVEPEQRIRELEGLLVDGQRAVGGEGEAARHAEVARAGDARHPDAAREGVAGVRQAQPAAGLVEGEPARTRDGAREADALADPAAARQRALQDRGPGEHPRLLAAVVAGRGDEHQTVPAVVFDARLVGKDEGPFQQRLHGEAQEGPFGERYLLRGRAVVPRAALEAEEPLADVDVAGVAHLRRHERQAGIGRERRDDRVAGHVDGVVAEVERRGPRKLCVALEDDVLPDVLAEDDV